jgi:outer membrane PBP1 activator LpoA protein
MVFLALDQATTRAVRPYISGTLPLYTTSLGVDPRAEPTVNVDLEGVRYVDMPWFVQPDHPAVMVYPTPSSQMSVEQERLYALGIDAYRLSGLLLQADLKSFPLDGVTGRIALDADRHFTRSLVPAGFDSGRAVPLSAAQ